MRKIVALTLLLFTGFMLQCGNSSHPAAQTVGPQGPAGPRDLPARKVPLDRQELLDLRVHKDQPEPFPPLRWRTSAADIFSL